MKILSILVILSLTLSSCSVYKGTKRIEQYPAKNEYRCVDDVCKDINTNYKVEFELQDKYKNLSEEELKNERNKKKRMDRISNYVILAVFVTPFVIKGMSGVNLSTIGPKVGAGVGILGVLGLTGLFLAYGCYEKGEDKYYDFRCYTNPTKPEENKKSNEVIKTEPLPASQ